MDSRAGLSRKLRERVRLKGSWLDRVTGLAAGDERIAAVWLFGSEADGTGDELSDIDLFVAFHDPAELVCVPDWLARFGKLEYAKEDPYNAPDEGRFFAALYAAQPLPILVDSYWQPASGAQLGSDTRVLIDKLGLPLAQPARTTFELIPSVREGLPYLRPSGHNEPMHDAIEWFWSNVLLSPSTAPDSCRGPKTRPPPCGPPSTTSHNTWVSPKRPKSTVRPACVPCWNRWTGCSAWWAE
jgi:predicted nucleotidyltransferase